jgi:hypothetical protein
MPEEQICTMRRNTITGQTEVVNCPYDWIPISNTPENILSLPMYAKACASVGSPLCIGSCCAIYPCERVRDFSEGKI